MLENAILDLQPINYYSLKHELCFYIGPSVSNRFPNEVEELKRELLGMDCITVCRHVKKNDSDYYIMMTRKHLFFADRNVNNNFAINNIKSDREFQARKNDFYHQGVFLIITAGGSSVVVNNQKYTSSKEVNTDWGMEQEVIFDLCNKIDDYFFNSEDGRHLEKKVDLSFEKQILTPLSNFTYYEDVAEQIGAYGDNYFVYDSRSVGRGKAKNKIYSFVSSSFDDDDEKFQPGDRVAIETNEYINDELKRKINGTIQSREITDKGICIDIEIVEQFDEIIIPSTNGHIYLRANETQKRVREDVIKRINNGMVESAYMYQLFSKYKPAGYEEQEGWDEFYEELMQAKYPPNKSQMEAIKRGIETKDIQLVLGPPGTGKTTVIVSWIKYFIGQGKRVLVSSQNNSAVDNVLERVGKNEKARVIRLGNIDKIQDNCKQYSTEMQVDATAEHYLKKLSENEDKLRNNYQLAENEIVLVSEMMGVLNNYSNVFFEFSKYKEQIHISLKKISELNDDIKLLFDEYQIVKNEFTQKTIKLEESESRNVIWQYINKNRIDYYKGKIQELTENLEEKRRKLNLLIPQYNRLISEFKAITEIDKYKECKLKLRGYQKQVDNIHISLEFEGPLDAPTLPNDFYKLPVDEKLKLLGTIKNELMAFSQKTVRLLKAIEDWKMAVNSKRNEIVSNLLIQNSNVVGATCIGINTRPQFKNLYFDVSIIDESGQIQIHNAIVPMSRAPKTLMLGDHLQIPPMANDVVVDLCKKDGVNTSLLEMSFFEFLFTKLEKRDPNVPNLTRLDEQFRMPGNISDVISDWFYGGNYHAHYDMSKWQPIISGTHSPLILISTSKVENRFEQGPNDTADSSPGYCNPLEAIITAKILNKVFKEAGDLDNERVGVISAYGKQVRTIRRYIDELNIGFGQEQIHSMVASLDSFQGQERPLIIYSSTRSTSYKKANQARVGFMKELRRLNVAFTRCQKQLVIIGDFDYLTTCEYEELDPNTNEPVPNKSEKKYAEFIQKMVDQAKSQNGEFYFWDEFCEKVGIDFD